MSDDKQCTSTTQTGFGPIQCFLETGHVDSHMSAEYTWPNVQPLQQRDPSIEQLTGRKHDDLFYELFERMAALEQGRYANGPATDDMVADLRKGLAEVEKRMTLIERLLDPDAGRGSDYRALQSSLMNHMNRALSDFGGELGALLRVRFDTVQDHVRQVRELLEPRTVQQGSHVVQEDLSGHPGECHGEMCMKSAPVQEERASGSPAPARCPVRFREGPCLGYDGHDGPCSAVPSDNPQLEDPDEFEECGQESYPGLGQLPCGLARGHDGPHASGPQD